MLSSKDEVGEAMDVSIGQKTQRTTAVTEGMVADYAKITGDYNPLHFDTEFTSHTRFGRLMAQGGITTGLLHALVAMDMPGTGTEFISQEWRFPLPVYIGDTITAEATVTSVRDGRPIATMEFVVRNQSDKEVLRGEATVYQASPSD
jgi:acyl dehydratase